MKKVTLGNIGTFPFVYSLVFQLPDFKMYNITHINHGNGITPNKDFEIFKKHRVNDELLTLLLSMV